MLYKFQQGLQWCDEMGFPDADGRNIEVVRQEIDLRQAILDGDIRFGSDGVYLKRGGREYRGYIYLLEAWIKIHNSPPKFHLKRCTTIEEFIVGHKIQRYGWSNAPTNDIHDIQEKDFVLEEHNCAYCGNCARVFRPNFRDTKGFHEELMKNQPRQTSVAALNVVPSWNDILA